MPHVSATSVTPDDLVGAVRTGIAALADRAKAAPMQAYMKSAMPYRGVTARPLSRFCKELFDRERLDTEDDWHEAVLALWDGARFREERYAATTLARHRHYREHQQPHTLDLYRHLVVTGAWWDHVDEVATHLVRGLLERHPDAITPHLHDWARDDDLWVRRSAIVCQVGGVRLSTGTCWSMRSMPTSTDRPAPRRPSRRTAGSSSCASRSAGRCATTRAPTRSGCARSSPTAGPGSAG